MEGEACFWLILENLSDLFRKEGHLVDAGIGRRLQNAKNDPLILCGRQFLGRLGIKKDRQNEKGDPHHVNGGACRERAIQQPRVKVLNLRKTCVNVGREPTMFDPCIQQLR